MYIQVSKVFAKFMNQTAKERNIQFSARVVTMSESQYRMFVGEPWDNEADYIGSDTLKAICVEYPYDYYCGPRYVSTDDLCRECRRQGVATLEALKDVICDMFAI